MPRLASRRIPIDRARARRRRRALVLALVLAGIVWAAFAVRAVLVARNEATEGLDVLDAAKGALSPQDFLRGRGRDRLEQARGHFADANRAVRNPLLAPVKLLPYVGRQVRSVEGLSGGATDVLDVGIAALRDAKAVVDAAQGPRGRERIVLVQRLGRVAFAASRSLDDVSIGPGQALIGPLRRAHDRFAAQLSDLRDNVDGLAAASAGFASFLGDARYLVIAANNSEMRVGTGAFLSLGEMTVRDGSFDLGRMQPAISLRPRAGAVDLAAFDRDLAARWGFMRPADDFRELAVTSRFDAVAPVALEMWRQRTGRTLDGVLVLDPIALRSLLTAVGPVVVDGVSYNDRNLLQQVFVEQYRGLTLDPSRLEQQARRERLSGIARAAIRQLERGRWDTVKLVDAMRTATLGRHVLLWSKRNVEERGWRGARLDGGIPPDGLLVAVHNRAGNKLDQFLPADATFDAAVAPDGATDATLAITLTNETDMGANLPNYVVGPYPGTFGGAAGRYIGWVVAELPRGAFDTTVDLDGRRVTQLVAAGRDGPDQRVVAAFAVWDPGQRHQVTVRFRLPPGTRSLELQPSARVLNPRYGGRAAVQWHVGTETFGDGQRRRVSW